MPLAIAEHIASGMKRLASSRIVHTRPVVDYWPEGDWQL
jgi:hypothetical protein